MSKMQKIMVKNKLYELEALRGIASLVVFIWHFLIAFYPKTTGYYDNNSGLMGNPLFALINGSAAVVFFFVLSGFVLTYKFFLTNDNSYLVNSILKRYFRLVLPILISIMLSYLLFSMNFYYYESASEITRSKWLVKFANSQKGGNIIPSFIEAFLQGIYFCLFKGESYYNNNLWTMKVEFFGSIISFCISPIIIHSKKIGIALFSLILFFIFYFSNTYYVSFLSGTLIAYWFSRKKTFKISKLSTVIIIFLSFILMGFFKPVHFYEFLNNQFISINKLRIYLYTFASILIIMLFLSNVSFKKYFNGKVGMFLGNISFPLYLLHSIIICSFSSYIYLVLYRYITEPILLLLLTFSITLPFIIICSYMLHIIDKKWTTFLNDLIKTHSLLFNEISN